MKKLYILLIILLGCNSFDLLEEQGGPVDYLQSVSEGWYYFQRGTEKSGEDALDEFKKADEYFKNALGSQTVPGYAAAYIGLGWNQMYWGNNSTLSGIINNETRDSLKISSLEYLNLAKNEYLSELEFGDDEVLNMFSGLAYANSFLAKHRNDETSDDLTQISIEESQSLIDFCDLNGIEFEFIYHTEIDMNDIYKLRVQNYLRLGEFDNARNEISNIDYPGIIVEFYVDLSDESAYSTGEDFSQEISLYAGFSSLINHYYYSGDFSQEENNIYKLQKTFTPDFPCSDLNIDEISDNELITCMDSFVSTDLEYRFALGQTSSVFSDENLSGCIDNEFRIIDLGSILSESVILDTVCFGKCEPCSSE